MLGARDSPFYLYSNCMLITDYSTQEIWVQTRGFLAQILDEYSIAFEIFGFCLSWNLDVPIHSSFSHKLFTAIELRFGYYLIWTGWKLTSMIVYARLLLCFPVASRWPMLYSMAKMYCWSCFLIRYKICKHTYGLFFKVIEGFTWSGFISWLFE